MGILILKRKSYSDNQECFKTKLKRSAKTGLLLGGLGAGIGAICGRDNKGGGKIGATVGGVLGAATGLAMGWIGDKKKKESSKLDRHILRGRISSNKNEVSLQIRALFDPFNETDEIDDDYGLKVLNSLGEILNSWWNISDELFDNCYFYLDYYNDYGPIICFSDHTNSLVRFDHSWHYIDSNYSTPIYKGNIKDYLISFLRKNMINCRNSNNLNKTEILKTYERRINDLQKLKE